MRAPSSRLALTVGGVGLALSTVSVAVPLTWPEVAAAGWSGSAAVTVIDALGVLGAIVVGTLVATRRPGNRYGWLLLSLGLVGATLQTTSAYATVALLVRPGHLPLGWAAAWLASGLWLVLIVHLPLLLLLFPDGHLPSHRWRRLVWVTLISAGVALAAMAFVPGQLGVVAVDNPNALSGVPGTVLQVMLGVAVFGVFLAIPAAAASVLIRRGRAGVQERLQLKWFLFAAGLLGAQIAATGAGAFIASDLVNAVLLTLALNAVFAAIGIAVLRYRLYEIDRIVSRTLAYALITALLAGVYALSVVALRLLLAPVTGHSDVAVAGSTLAVAALFGPVRRRVQAVVDRRFNRARYDAARTVEQFGARLRDQVDLAALRGDLGRVVAVTMAPAHVSVWLRRGEARP